MQDLSSSPPPGGVHHHHSSGASIPVPSPTSLGPNQSPGVPSLPGLRRLTLLSYGAGAVVGVGATAAVFGVEAIGASPVLQAGVAGLGAAALIGIGWGASRRADRIDRDLRATVRGMEVATAKISHTLTTLTSGPTHQPPVFLDEPSLGSLAAQIARLQWQAQQLRDAAANAPTPPAAPPSSGTASPTQHRRDHVSVLVNLARRLQVRLHYSILEIEELERAAEDPNLMKSLYDLDLGLMILRRWVENLVVLGGGPPHRQWTRPVRLGDVVRGAIAEVEKFARVRPVPPAEEESAAALRAQPPTLRGDAAADVNHLLADLIENATNFSDPTTMVEIRTSMVNAGAAVEIVDRGLGFKRRGDLDRLNALLKDPESVGFEALLTSGRIGLYVVAVLAHKHGIAVELQPNLYGGTTAVVIVPPALLGTESRSAEPVRPQPAEPAPALQLAAAPAGRDEALSARRPQAGSDRPALPQRSARHRDPYDDQPRAGRTASDNTADPALWSRWLDGLSGSDTTTNTQES